MVAMNLDNRPKTNDCCIDNIFLVCCVARGDIVVVVIIDDDDDDDDDTAKPLSTS